MHLKGNELGIVVSHRKPPTHLSFIFQLNDDIDVKVGEFVEVPIGKYVLVGRIVLITAYNEYLENPEFIRDHMQRGLSISARFPIDIGRWRAAKVEIIAMFSGDRIHPPNIPPEPGEMVYRAGTEVLRKLLGIREDGLFLGTMYGNSELKVKINPESLVRLHFAVFGTTGSGKSYTVGVLVEELLEKNFPVVIIDPHGEYFTFREKNDDMSAVAKLSLLGLTTRGYPTQIFYPSYGGSGNLSLNFSQLNTDAIAEMANLTPVMRDLLYLAMRNLRDSGIKKITPDLLLSTVNEIASKWGFYKKTTLTLSRNISLLKELGIFGTGFDPKEIVKPGQLTIIDLSGDIEEHIRRIFVGAILQELFNARKKNLIPPLLVIVEESHRFAPQEEDTYSKTVMRKIAREGRKFGIGLGVVSQRIVGLDKDVISQCGTKFILRIDTKTDLDYLRPYLEISSEEDARRIPYLPTGVAMVTGRATRYPILINVRPRKSKHGGSFI